MIKCLPSTILGLTFLLSGVIKGIDPMGMIYKLEEYFSAFGLSSLDALVFPFAIILCAIEVALGLLLLLNRWKRTTAITTTLFIAIFTAITYILYTNPYIGISDCGCFGDAIHLSNAQTFWKNVVLTLLAILHLIIVFKNKIYTPKTSNTVITLLVTLFSISIPIYSYIFLPPFDFLDFNIGSNLKENSEFAIFDENQNNVTNQLIYQNAKPTYLIGVRDQLKESDIDVIEPLIKKAQTGEVNLLLTTPKSINPLARYNIRALYIDDILLKSLLRQDKGIVLIDNDTIKAKWQIEFNINYYNSHSGVVKLWTWLTSYLLWLSVIIILNLKSDYGKETPQKELHVNIYGIDSLKTYCKHE